MDDEITAECPSRSANQKKADPARLARALTESFISGDCALPSAGVVASTDGNAGMYTGVQLNAAVLILVSGRGSSSIYPPHRGGRTP
jgi:hypothetical protein